MILLRSLLFILLFYLLTTVLAILGLPVLLLSRHAVQNLARFWARSSIWLLDKICRTKVEFRGLEHLPQGGCIIAAKHQSTLETLALTTITSDFSYVLKRELLSIPIFGWYLKGAEQIALDRAKRGQALADLTKQVSEAVAKGRQIFIFPEGTRKAAGAPPDYKSGVAHLYVSTSAICAPVALNSGLFWPRRGLSIQPGVAVIAFLEPIQPGLDKQGFMSLLQDRIEAATADLIAESLANDPSLKNALAERLGPAVP
ncbi:lysophospholipid acyltransferase family protein [Methylocapsa aurea]|uniref:lysophospholipid acyltransferase family protein n=1 Tax=Methylocapsa aurea TaxID=663610 RepID=UPI00055C2309|nr:lysophospholipid acyltransferase family protein [Methylocapsa aurea]